MMNYKTGSELIYDFLSHAMMTLTSVFKKKKKKKKTIILLLILQYHITLQCFTNSLASSS